MEKVRYFQAINTLLTLITKIIFSPTFLPFNLVYKKNNGFSILSLNYVRVSPMREKDIIDHKKMNAFRSAQMRDTKFIFFLSRRVPQQWWVTGRLRSGKLQHLGTLLLFEDPEVFSYVRRKKNAFYSQKSHNPNCRVSLTFIFAKEFSGVNGTETVQLSLVLDNSPSSGNDLWQERRSFRNSQTPEHLP